MDKVKHIIVSAGLVIGLSLFIPLWGAVLLTAIAGIAKELRDAYIDPWDLVANAVGISIGIVICII